MINWQSLFNFDPKINIGLTGMTDSFFAVYLNCLKQKIDRPIVIVTSTLYEANQLYNAISSVDEKVLFYPMDDFLTSEAIAISPDFMINRLDTLDHIVNNKRSIIITNLMGYLRFLPTPKVYQNNILTLKINDDIDPKKLQEKLYRLGYNRETIVTRTGEVGIRGFVIDLFPIGEEHPIRIEFFGDTIESIRQFDEETQKSIGSISSVTIRPYTEFLLDNEVEIPDDRHQKFLPLYSNQVSDITSYLEDPLIIFKDYHQLYQSYIRLEEEIFEYRQEKEETFKDPYMFSFNDIKVKDVIHYLTVDSFLTEEKDLPIVDFHVHEIPSFQENIDAIRSFLQNQLHSDKTIILFLKEYQLHSFEKNIHLPVHIAQNHNIKNNHINVIFEELPKGFLYQNVILLSDKDLFKVSSEKKKYKTTLKYASKLKNINALSIGDYVVHTLYGIGIYNGMKTLTKNGIQKDYIEVLYQGTDKLYIPVEKIDLLHKYTGKEGAVPKISHMGGIDWKKTKQRVRSKIQDIAEKLLLIYAQRELKKGFSFSPDTPYQLQFEAQFPYDATKDQLLASTQIKQDMESSLPMDRLLCGDVGYGKTEVAFRAIFKAVMDSKQVLYLCPTTILSNQHYENAKMRFKDFPVSIALLNRFTTPKEAKRIIEGLKNGTIDVVIGTHRLLSSDIKPKNLGLLVIDEEQRFGVTHKEKIKEFKANVDVLTLTATPIPRTLQMSMTGMRSLSLIETPPVDRYPIQTYVLEENDQVIKEAIYKELSRNGQVFLLYNRVETILTEVDRIQRLVPNAKITYAHGQMTKVELEDRMLSFVNHEYDVLICTTIIETGIDIPNVNTLIIKDADRFGLSQLYQIRGRVGRSNKIAYAYLMYHPARVLTETAMKRLQAIKEFTELGSGFSIATRDLSIRGAGDILGSEQAGFIDTIGIDLYLKMLQEEVDRLKGITPLEEELQEAKPLLEVETHIDDNYVDDTDLKIEIHRMINNIDSFEKLQDVEQELNDRFGKIKDSLITYMYEEWFEKLAASLEIKNVRQTRNSIEVYFPGSIAEKIDVEQLFVDAFHITTMFRFQSKKDAFVVILDTIRLEKHPVYYLVELLSTIKFK